jgi:hypothetical protein
MSYCRGVFWIVLFSSLAKAEVPQNIFPLTSDYEIYFASDDAKEAHQAMLLEISTANPEELKKKLKDIEIQYRDLPKTTNLEEKLKLAKKIEKLKFTIEISENLKKVNSGQLRLLSVRTNKEANQIHPFTMTRIGGTDPYPTSNPNPVYTFETLDNSTETVYLQKKPSELTKVSEIPIKGSYSTPPTQKTSSVFVTGDQQRDLTASTPNSTKKVDQIFVRASLEKGTVFQVGTIGSQLEGDFTGSGGNIQYASQRQNEKLIQAYEKSSSEGKTIYENYFQQLAESRGSQSNPDLLKEAESRLREHIQLKQPDFSTVFEETKPVTRKKAIRYQDAIDSKNDALLEIQKNLSAFADEKDSVKAAAKEIYIKHQISKVEKKSLTEQEQIDLEKIKSNFTQYVEEKTQKQPTYQSSRDTNSTKTSSLETNHVSPPQSTPETNNKKLASSEATNHASTDKASGRIGCLQTAAESQGILSSGGRLSAANLAALAACGLDEASFRAYAKGGSTKVGNLASGASTAIGGGLSLLALYQGATGSSEELKKVDYEKFKEAINSKNPELLKEAFKKVDKLNLASSATTATEGALGTTASVATLVGAPAVATVATAGSLVIAIPAAVLYSYKRGEDINNEYKNDLSQLSAYEKSYTENLRKLSIERNKAQLSEFRISNIDKIPENFCKQNLANKDSKKITQEPDSAAGKTCQTRLQTVTNSFAEGKFQDAAAKAPHSIGFDFCKEGVSALKNGQNNPKALQQAYIHFLGCREASRAASQFLQRQIYFIPGKTTKDSFTPRSLAGIVLFTDQKEYKNNKSFQKTTQDLKHKGPNFIYLLQDPAGKRNFLEEKKNYEAYLNLNKNESDSLAAFMKRQQFNNESVVSSYCSEVYSKLEAIDMEVEALKIGCTTTISALEARLTAEQKQQIDELFRKEGLNKQGAGLDPNSFSIEKNRSLDTPRH